MNPRTRLAAAPHASVQRLADALDLGTLLDRSRTEHGGYELCDHWQQGEFHHDVVVRVAGALGLPGPVLVVATNCNGGVKEVLCFDALPTASALWHARCPTSSEFEGELPELRARAATEHFFDPCELLVDDARSELLPEHRERQVGGGWCRKRQRV